MASRPMTTLSGRDYTSAEVFDLEREKVFFRGWLYAGRESSLEAAGDFLTVDIAGESVLVVRDADGGLNAFYNVCRHRGSRLCDEASGRMKGAVKCPYHAWAYSFDGRLIGTPNVGKEEIDRDQLGLWPVSIDVWEGFAFISFEASPPPLVEWLTAGVDPPISFTRFNLGELRTAHTTLNDVRANWKILIDNYNECLHCPTVHPELVQVVPTFRKGQNYDTERSDGGVALAGGGNSFTPTGQSDLPLMPGLSEEDETSLYGSTVYPNMFIDITGTGAIATGMYAKSPSLTTVVTEYLFRPEAIAAEGFSPAEVVQFSELVARQDYDVCERVQLGVGSRAFTHGVLAEKDEMLERFNARYRELRAAE